MRIIGGSLKGFKLKVPKGISTRPSSEKVRSALFNIIGPRIRDSLFLDLFAGSGAVGLEALSRGARKAVFVENSRLALQCLEDNLARSGLTCRGEILPLDVRQALSLLQKRGDRFDFIFLDPPYGQGWATLILPRLASLLSPGGEIIWEGERREEVSEVQGLKLKDRRVYGDTALNFYRLEEGESYGSHGPDRRDGGDD
ncbi:MAG TPA: 16S rRNA (guanine(966)-N(2))-methyltransferase RsmD [Moorella mulderi]|nr:16S rRNA (guanine(966)-N(2))-methyltransferase RsmD [Moorella mulderi]